MRLLERNNAGDICLTEVPLGSNAPRYAILSHTWGAEEVSFKDLMDGTGKDKLSYHKIRFCGEQAWRDNLRYFWVDTCCINKPDNTELQEAINSMFRWYRGAAKCYVYLEDVSTSARDADGKRRKLAWEAAFQKSRWFTRGWTLQELIAPVSVQFFSKEGVLLGDRTSLEQDIHHITGIPLTAIQGSPLSNFGVTERLAWIAKRDTTRKEDKAYSLLGIFDIHMPLIYGEGEKNAFRRLREEIKKAARGELPSTVQASTDRDAKCLEDLRITDPRDDKIRIEQTKGGLLKDSYRWILNNPNFRGWRDDENSRLLWIKGDPGKGKTMLLCGIIDEVTPSTRLTDPEADSLLSYFFCQATDSRINNATAVLRGLIYLLVKQQPLLVQHVQERYKDAGRALFEDVNAWVALSDIFTNILRDPSLLNTSLVVDALDECAADLPLLLDLITLTTSSHRVKWIISSRNWPQIEEKLFSTGQTLSLELNAESVSAAVDTYIQHEVLQLAQLKKYSADLQEAVCHHLSLNANGTFLWVALVCQNLKHVSRLSTRGKLVEYPPGLNCLYERMMAQICASDVARLCKSMLASVTVAYRPFSLEESTSLLQMPKDTHDVDYLREIVDHCGSFLTVRNDIIYFVHQSAKDFLLGKASSEIFPHGTAEVHSAIFSRSLEAMTKPLRRDMYCLRRPGFPIEQVKIPKSDPLAAVRYSCVYWIEHLVQSNAGVEYDDDIRDGGKVDAFLRQKYLYWLESLSVLNSTSEGVLSMSKLQHILQGKPNAVQLSKFVRDAYRFLMYFKWALENNPLQAYASALVFAPACSVTKDLFKEEEPKWITAKPVMEDDWSPCRQTLEGHSDPVSAVAFSRDGSLLASASWDKTVKLWDTATGRCRQTLEGHSRPVSAVAFSRDGSLLASASWDKTVKLWDTATGRYRQTLEGHSNPVSAVTFSRDGSLLASASFDKTVKLWDTATGRYRQTLEGHSNPVSAVTFSRDGSLLASASFDKTVKLWDTATGRCRQTLEGHSDRVSAVAFLRDGLLLASASFDKTVKLWDTATGRCRQTLEGHSHPVSAVAFSRDGSLLASASFDKNVKLWDTATGRYRQTLEGHSHPVSAVAFSRDGPLLASASFDKTVKLWDTATGRCRQTLEGHSHPVIAVAFSRDGSLLASASYDKTVKLWDTATGRYRQTLEGHSHPVSAVTFSRDGSLLASASWDKTVKLWDAATGRYRQTLEGHSHPVSAVAFSRDGSLLASASFDKTVKLWDATTGQCRQTLDISRNLSTLSFDTTDSRLHTDIGTILLDPILLSASNASSIQMLPQSPQQSRYQGYGVSSNGAWITWNSEKLLWLPSEYRPVQSAVAGSAVVLGCSSGQVLIFQFSAEPW